MKKFLVFCVLCLATYVYATSYGIRGAGTEGSDITIVQDTSWTAIVDTSLSDTVDVSKLGVSSKLFIGMRLGAVDLCDSCNDSVIIIVQTITKNLNSTTPKIIWADTFGGNNITALDDSTIWKAVPADSLYGQKLYFRTIVKDAITHAWTGATPAAALRTLTVPMNIDITVRTEDTEQ